VKVTVRCFAAVREALGREVLDVDVPEGTTVLGLREQLATDAPDLQRLPLAYAVNQDYADGETKLSDGDEVAFIPPISGGSEPETFRFDLSHESLDPRPLEQEVRSDQDGAVVTFAGVTRDHNDGKAVMGLRYECYDEMARKVMDRLFADALDRFAISRVRVAHRVGKVPVGEASVLVVVAAEHREPAFEATRWLMDRLKAEVPIFKKEDLADGRSQWVGDLPDGPA
jgi:MoaE-MoaD fusion protein